jgi:glycosyltransferase involved in cell wall biosynthesis
MASPVPLVTVIIATYNKSSTLRYAIDSVLWQTLADFELWVIGDACTDDTSEVVATYDDPRVFWYNLPENSGYQSAPNNEGLRRARGEYIAYLNHDDLWFPNHLRVLVDQIEESGADFAFSILEVIRPNGHSRVEIPEYPYAALPPHASAVLHRREVVDDIGYWLQPNETYLFPRIEYFRRAEARAKRFVLVPMLTALMVYDVDSDRHYSEATLQPELMSEIRTDPYFAQKRLAWSLAKAQWELERPVTLRRLRIQMQRFLQRTFVRRGHSVERLSLWIRPGERIAAWQQRHGLLSSE